MRVIAYLGTDPACADAIQVWFLPAGTALHARSRPEIQGQEVEALSRWTVQRLHCHDLVRFLSGSALNQSPPNYGESLNCTRGSRDYICSMSEFRPPVCPTCNQAMELMRTIPAVGPAWPALLAFHCKSCNEAETVEEAQPQNRPVASPNWAAVPPRQSTPARTN